MPWYIFRITPPGDVTNPTDYMRVTHKPIASGTKLAAIQTNDNGFGFPVLSNTIMCEIATALNSASASQNVVLRSL